MSTDVIPGLRERLAALQVGENETLSVVLDGEKAPYSKLLEQRKFLASKVSTATSRLKERFPHRIYEQSTGEFRTTKGEIAVTAIVIRRR
jgi:hypothetical protein